MTNLPKLPLVTSYSPVNVKSTLHRNQINLLGIPEVIYLYVEGSQYFSLIHNNSQRST